jgi:hypothetical protein
MLDKLESMDDLLTRITCSVGSMFFSRPCFLLSLLWISVPSQTSPDFDHDEEA